MIKLSLIISTDSDGGSGGRITNESTAITDAEMTVLETERKANDFNCYSGMMRDALISLADSLRKKSA